MAALAAIPAFLAANAGTIAAISTAVTAAGTIAAGQAQANQHKVEGRAAQQSAEFEAEQLEQKATQEKAAGQRDMLQYRRQKKLALSTLQAKAAGSGFTATDPTALALADEIERYGTLQEQMAMFGGTSRERGLKLSAKARRFSGRMAAQAGRDAATGSYFKAGGTILGGVSSMAQKYAKRPITTSTTAGRYG